MTGISRRSFLMAGTLVLGFAQGRKKPTPPPPLPGAPTLTITED